MALADGSQYEIIIFKKRFRRWDDESNTSDAAVATREVLFTLARNGSVMMS